MKKQKLSILVVLLGLTIVACSKKAVAPVTPDISKEETVQTGPAPAPAPAPVVNEATLAEGKSLYEANCAHCHKLFSPAKHTKEEWTGVLNRMAPKARINDEQKNLVYLYLTNS